jgi:hypothetical protein
MFFLSYSRADQEFALRLATDLRFAGGSIWVDQFDILPSARWDRAVEAALRDANGLLLILSPRSVASENVLDEVSVAIDAHKQIIPVLFEKCVLPLRLSRVQFIDATADYTTAFERCKAAVLGKAWNASGPLEPSDATAPATQTRNRHLPSDAFAAAEDLPAPGARGAVAPPQPAAAPQALAPQTTAPHGAAPAAGEFDTAFLDNVARLLTFHIGPLARHVVTREQRGARDREDLYMRLCARVPAERERGELLRKLRAL